ncbi:zonular occludens toxin domain-containing protein [Stenotrophomonas rhizophila]|uniref:zonular occludens toxin domain-containing protein n=1 Tax=Stenotrophomonas rhizophila TaxID=216778 RepID=UPI001E5E602C|nr:zonular occludens toxin domain-containing protein [Stenotrophomonas rhizophila]MCC7635363.1 zonular occludens toxin domain-containing protein [Stenotrophomonas rhizophila]MCC7664408.1 zonular occludens toxin domain-containing protein [Stenotrophomonas rhizophila]
MLVFNEGVPRAGKSYDAVKNHILPAIKKGRRVYARLNGLRHDKIAKHLAMSEIDVQKLLVCVDTKDVAGTFACVQDESGKWCIPDEFKDALVVIDEVHEFYVNERKPLPPAVENFWALLGQNGGDGVIMTQWINRLHSAVKARIERKNTFQKLTVVGAKTRYRVTFFHTTSPGKFEKVGGQTLKYDPAIFPLYDGYAPGAENTEVYEEGGKSVWAAMGMRAAIFVVLGAVGLVAFLGFFKKSEPAEAPATAAQGASAGAQAGLGGVGLASASSVAAAVPVPKPDPLADLTSEQRYVAGLSEKARIRLAMLAQVDGQNRASIHWISNDSGEVIEELDIRQLRSLGFAVEVKTYGVRLSVGKHVMVATAWPMQKPIREKDARLYNLSGDGAGAGPASVASGGGAGVVAQGNPGNVVVSVGVRPLGTFPESVQHTYSGK